MNDDALLKKASKREAHRHFRNIISNELKLTREDVIKMVNDCVQEKVEKLVGQINFESRAQKRIDDYSSKCVSKIEKTLDSYIKEEVRAQVSKKILEKLNITVELKPEDFSKQIEPKDFNLPED